MEIPGKELERLIRAKEGEDKALHDEMIRRLSAKGQPRPRPSPRSRP